MLPSGSGGDSGGGRRGCRMELPEGLPMGILRDSQPPPDGSGRNGSFGLPAGLPRHESAEQGPTAAATPTSTAHCRGKRRAAWERMRRSPYFRRGAQATLGTAVVMGVCSIPAVWNGVSLDPIMANPAIILVRTWLGCLVGGAATAGASKGRAVE